MKVKTLFAALLALCVAVSLAAAQPSAAGPGKGKGKGKAHAAAAVKKGHVKGKRHANSGGHKAGKGHSKEAEQPVSETETPATEQTEGEVEVQNGEAKNHAQACKDEREQMGAEAFAEQYGTNRDDDVESPGYHKNAFGKCVSGRANGSAAEEAAAEETAPAGETTEGAPAGTEGGDAAAGGIKTTPSVPDNADAHERQADQLAELIRRLEELLAQLRGELGASSASAPATP